ncbi:hypothetical protein K439DRAFT_1624481 [Ramaria rubella]|nr:hypothetical protein K439DRAFT_1624481 [Ramaria rubella]
MNLCEIPLATFYSIPPVAPSQPKPHAGLISISALTGEVPSGVQSQSPASLASPASFNSNLSLLNMFSGNLSSLDMVYDQEVTLWGGSGPGSWETGSAETSHYPLSHLTCLRDLA